MSFDTRHVPVFSPAAHSRLGGLSGSHYQCCVVGDSGEVPGWLASLPSRVGPGNGLLLQTGKCPVCIFGDTREGEKRFPSPRLPFTGSRPCPVTCPRLTPTFDSSDRGLATYVVSSRTQAPGSNPSTFTRESVLYPELDLAL